MGVSVVNKTVCVTGEVPGLSRDQANARLREAGAHTVSTVTKNTHLLITGGRVGPRKIEKAETLGVAVVPWEDVSFDGTGDEAPVSRAAPPPKVLAARQVAPMLCAKAELEDTLKGSWAYEIKWDGIRAVATIQDGSVSIQSRSAKTDLTVRFPDVAAALTFVDEDGHRAFPDCVLDGEMVVLTEEEIGGSFGQIAKHSESGAATFVVFDVIECQGQDLRHLTFAQRRDLLETIVSEDTNRIAKSPLWDDGEALMAHVVKHGIEGIVAKPLESTYREGSRGPWAKIKVRLSQEFVVVGYTYAEGQFTGGVGALMLAAHDENGQLVMCGAAGTGLTKEQRYQFVDDFAPFENPAVEDTVAMTDKERRQLRRENAVWMTPELVVQVQFQRWTDDGRLWHPAFIGFRDDKDATDVTLDR